jgi:hypothetical protein
MHAKIASQRFGGKKMQMTQVAIKAVQVAKVYIYFFPSSGPLVYMCAKWKQVFIFSLLIMR